MKKQYITPVLKLHLIKNEPLMGISRPTPEGTTPEVPVGGYNGKTEESESGEGLND